MMDQEPTHGPSQSQPQSHAMAVASVDQSQGGGHARHPTGLPVQTDAEMIHEQEGATAAGHTETKVTRVRELLREMLTADIWTERTRDEWERKQLRELRACVLDDASVDELQRLPKRMCAYEFKPGDIAWNCKVCQVDETCVMCNDCFIASDHEDHEVFFYYTHSGGCCDCGDPEAWARDGFCTRHRGAQDADPLAYIPPEVVTNARACLTDVLGLVLRTVTEARGTSIITSDDVDRVRAALELEPPERRFSVIVHYNELQSSQEFASALTRAVPAMSYQTLKIVGEASTQKQSLVRAKATRDEALEVADGLQRQGLTVSIVTFEYKSKTSVVSTLLQWLVSLANLSDGLCRLICEQFIAHSCGSLAFLTDDPSFSESSSEYPVLRAVILADSFLPKSVSDSLHSLLMALLADPIFKKAFAVAFTRSYRQLYREFITGIGSSSVTILAFSVQFFNRASFVKLLVADHELLEVLIASVLETLRRKRRELNLSISSSGRSIVKSWDAVSALLLPSSQPGDTRTIDIWDVYAMGIQRCSSKASTTTNDSDFCSLSGIDLQVLASEALASGLIVRKRSSSVHSAFLSLPPSTELPGCCELDVSSPVFLYRRYMSGLLDLRYALQIEGISECFVQERDGSRLADFLLYLSYIQGVCAETRRFGDHVEMESRGWVVTVEFVSTASDVFMWIISNVFKNVDTHNNQDDMDTEMDTDIQMYGSPCVYSSQLCGLITRLTKTIMEAFYFWLASTGNYFPPPEDVGHIFRPLRVHPIDIAVSCHYPLHRTFAQLIRTMCDSSVGLEMFYALIRDEATHHTDQDGYRGSSIWLHDRNSPIGFWHRVNLIEPVLQAIVWDAEVHSGLWVRNGMSVINHSMNYGEPPFCLRFRDLDLLLVQFGFQLLSIDWMMGSVMARFGVEKWYDISNSDRWNSELMATECMTLLCQFASELPPRVMADRNNTIDPEESNDAVLRSLIPFLRREIVQRLIVGPCAHSDLSKIATEFFLSTHENLFSSTFSAAPVLDRVLRDVCSHESRSSLSSLSMDMDDTSGEATFSSSSASASGGGKVLYRLKPDLYAEYSPTFIHLTRKQHEAAHENWFQHRQRLSKAKQLQQQTSRDASSDDGGDITPSTWLDFPIVKTFLPCADGFHMARLSILHSHARSIVYESLWRASTDVLSSLNVLSRAVQLFTLQIYVVEEIGYAEQQSTAYGHEALVLRDEFMEWITSTQPGQYSAADPRDPVFQLLLNINPWMPRRSGKMVNLDGDQKHEIGRGVDWLVRRLARQNARCNVLVESHQRASGVSREDDERKALLIKRRKDAQMRALQQMQQRQAAFAEQMNLMASTTSGTGDEDDETIDVAGDTEETSSDNNPQAVVRSISEPCDADDEVLAQDARDSSSDVAMDDDTAHNDSLPECAMCHSVESEDSFMCYVGFAQCSPVFSRLNGGLHGLYLSTPMDEMHFGEDVPVHLRLCGHSVHHTCWESYHASQFQRAITGGHHRHSLNAVDVTKKEFLCPLCKSISNVLIPTTTEEMDQWLDGTNSSSRSTTSAHWLSPSLPSPDSQAEVLLWLNAIGRENESEQDGSGSSVGSCDSSMLESGEARAATPVPPLLEFTDAEDGMQSPPSFASGYSSLSSSSSSVVPIELPPRMQIWLEQGLSSLCMAVHKVACGATQKSRPDRYTSSGCLTLFHTLLCTFLGSPHRDQIHPELRFFHAMRFIPLMLQQVTRPRVGAALTPGTSSVSRDQIAHLLYFGGSDVLPDGTIVLEDEHPTTQTQTRKQSQWGKVRWPTKPLLLSQLGSVLVKAVLLASSDAEAVYMSRLIMLARIVQALLWFSLTRDEDFAEGMAQTLEIADETVSQFTTVLFDEPNRNEAAAMELVEQLRIFVISQCRGASPSISSVTALTSEDDKKKLLNLVACDIMPMMKVATFLLRSRRSTPNGDRAPSTPPVKPVFVTIDDITAQRFVKLDALWAQDAALQPLIARWVQRFSTAYDEMNDPQGILQQWLSNADLGPVPSTSNSTLSLSTSLEPASPALQFPRILARDLNTVFTSMSVSTSGANRTRYLRSLPRAYVKFYAALAKRKCASCHQFPARPAVCLVCGMLLCAANTCPSAHADKGYPEESNPGACTVHAKKCGRGSCMFLLVLEGAVLLVYWKLAAYVGSLYVDEYGEEFGERNRELNKGRPLYLNVERRNRLLRLWRHHEIPNEVVRIQNSSDRVIRNSHY